MEYRRKLRFAIIGCGSAGSKRSSALPPGAVQVACDSSLTQAAEIAKQHHGCRATGSSEDVFQDPDIDALIICAPHAPLANLALGLTEAIKALELIEEIYRKNDPEVVRPP